MSNFLYYSSKRLAALLLAQRILKEKQATIGRSYNELSSSLDSDLDMISDEIFGLSNEILKTHNISDFDMSLVNFFKASDFKLDNIKLLGWEKS